MNSNFGCGLEMCYALAIHMEGKPGMDPGTDISGPGFVECEPVGGGLNLLEAGDHGDPDLEPEPHWPSLAHVGRQRGCVSPCFSERNQR